MANSVVQNTHVVCTGKEWREITFYSIAVTTVYSIDVKTPEF